MLKNLLLSIVLALTFTSCSLEDDGNTNLSLDTLPIKSQTVPESFVFGTIDTIKVVYELPDKCHSFYNLFYEYEGVSRKIAINTLVDNKVECTQVITEKELSFPIQIRQHEDYVLKFWKGKDTNGNNIFKEIIVPVLHNTIKN